MYYGPRIAVWPSLWFIVSLFNKERKLKKELEENTKEVTKTIYKGIVIAKDSKSNTYTVNNNVQTDHSYETAIRVPDINDTVYFDDKRIYMNCMEGEEVEVLVITNLDENGKVLAVNFGFAGNYKQFQDIKDKYIAQISNNLGIDTDEITSVNNIESNGYTIY